MGSNPIEEGLRLTLEKRVEDTDLASRQGTARAEVLSTSKLIMFIEKAVSSLISPYLEEGQDTVSSEINIKHFKPVGLGNKVRCIVHLKYVEGRKLFFDIAVFDENHEEVAIGAHCRHIINLVDFRASFK